MAKRVDHCPECGAEFPAGKLACPECGSDAETGWKSSDEIDYQSIEIPDAWPPPDQLPRPTIRWSYIAAVLALLAMIALVFGLSGLL